MKKTKIEEYFPVLNYMTKSINKENLNISNLENINNEYSNQVFQISSKNQLIF